MLKKNNTNSVIVVMPAYNAEKTLRKTVSDIPKNLVSEIILVDDASTDKTVAVAQKLNLTVITHTKNKGYGGNQKTCYQHALKKKPDVVVMIHPDYQYDATLLGELIAPILQGRYDMMFGSRIRTRTETLAGGMPRVKYVLNRAFCVFENMVLGANFSEYFSGMRAYSRKTLEMLPFEKFSNDFVFDQQMMIVAYGRGFRIGEIPIPVRYFSEASSIRYIKGSKFLLETLFVLVRYIVYQAGLMNDRLFMKK